MLLLSTRRERNEEDQLSGKIALMLGEGVSAKVFEGI